MNQFTMINTINKAYSVKRNLLTASEEHINAVAAAKAAVDQAKIDVTRLAEWAECKNDKMRDALLHSEFSSVFDDLTVATDRERQARLQLAHADNEIARTQTLVKVYCEWQGDTTEMDQLRGENEVLRDRLKAIHSAAANLQEVSRNDAMYAVLTEANLCQLRFILDESDTTPDQPFSGELPPHVTDFITEYHGGKDDK